MIVTKGVVFQISAKTAANMAPSGVESQSRGSMIRPAFNRMSLITPKGLLNIHCHIMAMTAVGRAQGTRTERRLKALPFKGALMSRGKVSPQKNSKGTVRIVNQPVFLR